MNTFFIFSNLNKVDDEIIMNSEFGHVKINGNGISVAQENVFFNINKAGIQYSSSSDKEDGVKTNLNYDYSGFRWTVVNDKITKGYVFDQWGDFRSFSDTIK